MKRTGADAEPKRTEGDPHKAHFWIHFYVEKQVLVFGEILAPFWRRPWSPRRPPAEPQPVTPNKYLCLRIFQGILWTRGAKLQGSFPR